MRADGMTFRPRHTGTSDPASPETEHPPLGLLAPGLET